MKLNPFTFKNKIADSTPGRFDSLRDLGITGNDSTRIIKETGEI